MKSRALQYAKFAVQISIASKNCRAIFGFLQFSRGKLAYSEIPEIKPRGFQLENGYNQQKIENKNYFATIMVLVSLTSGMLLIFSMTKVPNSSAELISSFARMSHS